MEDHVLANLMRIDDSYCTRRLWRPSDAGRENSVDNGNTVCGKTLLLASKAKQLQIAFFGSLGLCLIMLTKAFVHDRFRAYE